MDFLEYIKRESLAGASAGIVGTVLGYPLDVVKTRQQVSGISIPNAIQTIYRESGPMGYYRGMVAPLVSLTILNTLNFSTYSFARNGLQVPEQFDVTKEGFQWKVSFAGASVAPLCSLISTPFELIKTQMQLSASSSSSAGQTRYKNSVQAAVGLTKEHGVGALYRGFTVNMIREMVFLSTYFTVYEHLKSFQMHSSSLYPQSVAVPLAGGTAGALGWLVSFPLDLIKSNIQAKPFNGTAVPSGLQVAKHLLNTKGFLGLYSGVVPSILRAFIVSSSRFSAYETTMWLLSE